MYNTTIIINTIIYLSLSENVPLSPMKIQRLLYFIYCDYLISTGEPLFSERFECWGNGPVLSSLYCKLNSKSTKAISEFMKDDNEDVPVIDVLSETAAAKSVRRVWMRYKHYGAGQLAELSQRGAWEACSSCGKLIIDDDDILSAFTAGGSFKYAK